MISGLENLRPVLGLHLAFPIHLFFLFYVCYLLVCSLSLLLPLLKFVVLFLAINRIRHLIYGHMKASETLNEYLHTTNRFPSLVCAVDSTLVFSAESLSVREGFLLFQEFVCVRMRELLHFRD